MHWMVLEEQAAMLEPWLIKANMHFTFGLNDLCLSLDTFVRALVPSVVLSIINEGEGRI